METYVRTWPRGALPKGRGRDGPGNEVPATCEMCQHDGVGAQHQRSHQRKGI